MSDSAQVDQNQTDQVVNDPPPPNNAPDINQKILEELKKAKLEAKEAKDRLKTRETEELTKNQQYKELAELREKEALEAREETERYKTAVVKREKMSAIREAAIQSGIRKESIPDLRLIDFPELTLETNSEGEFTTAGADKAIQRLKTLRPHWFKPNVPKVNSDSPIVTGDGRSFD